MNAILFLIITNLSSGDTAHTTQVVQVSYNSMVSCRRDLSYLRSEATSSQYIKGHCLDVK